MDGWIDGDWQEALLCESLCLMIMQRRLITPSPSVHSSHQAVRQSLTEIMLDVPEGSQDALFRRPIWRLQGSLRAIKQGVCKEASSFGRPAQGSAGFWRMVRVVWASLAWAVTEPRTSFRVWERKMESERRDGGGA